jgi:uncharacterized protein (TIGR02265 family)
VESFRVTPSVALRGSFDPERRFAMFPPTYAIKGLFFPRLVEMLGDGFRAVAPTLRMPPKDGRYVPFTDYPQSDYSRIVAAAARRCFAGMELREAARRVAWKDIDVYGASRIGGVTLALLGDPRSALTKLPDLINLVLKGGTIVARDRGPSHVFLEYRRYFGWIDCYVIGTLEGIVQRFGKKPEIAVNIMGDGEATYDVTWS